MVVNSSRVPVAIDRDVYDAFKAYSELTGVPVARIVREALRDFKETSLQARLESLTQGVRKAPVVSIDSASLGMA